MTVKRFYGLLLVLGVGSSLARNPLHAGDASPNPIRQAPRILNSKDRNVGQFVPEVEFQDVAGKTHRLSEFSAGKGVVIAATSTSCPLSRKYLPTLAALAQKSHQQGLVLIAINPVATDKAAAIKDAAAELGVNAVYVHDQHGSLSVALGLTSTTDVVLIDPARTVRYHGAVDDQYGFGYAKEAPLHRYLESAIDEYLKGQTVVIATTEAPGCHVAFEDSTPAKTAVTYHNRISRLVQSKCGECHRDGGVGPFSLETRADLVAHAGMIETVVNRGTMPPWFATPLERDKEKPWINDCSLSDTDKADLLGWLKGAKAEGDPKDAPAPAKYPSGWTIGQPDLVVKFPEPIAIQATGVMRYKNVVVETDLEEDKWVRAIEVRPGAPEVVHHILVFAREPKGYRPAAGDEINYWGIYVPGNNKQVYPPGFARRLPKGSQIRFQIHYTPNGKATEDLTQVGFLFSDKPPENEVKTTSLVNAWFEIPPGSNDHQDFAKIKLPGDVTVLGFLPHMHLRGKSCRYEAVSPDGKRETLLDIPRYDFNWQLLYRYAEPQTFAKGTVLKFTAAFDNSDKNPANPDPKASVHWGDQTYDEMIVGYIEYFVPVTGRDAMSDVEWREPGFGNNREEALFNSLDADDDGKLTLDELRKLAENPRLKQANPLTIGVFFKGLDANNDDSLSLEEFQKIREYFARPQRKK